MSSENQTVEITSAAAKFCIGAVAGVAAIAIPRLISYATDANQSFTYLPLHYLGAVLSFALFIGALVVIFEYKTPKPPKETFFAALAIPGLLAGSFNTAVESQEANSIFAQNKELSTAIRENNEIAIHTVDDMTIVPLEEEPSPNPGVSFRFQLNPIGTAQAKDEKFPLQEREDFRISIQREKPAFGISIGSFADKNAAINEAKRLKKNNPSTTLIKTTQGYEILSSRKLLTESEAVLEAVKLGRKLNVKPKLITVKQ
ncbi:MAG: hypothetical protein OEZ68_17390 [Gammaproteobacteria bacterium]|nr:hypothetical protein [Gammaproteobacteria bacterium]MDH5802578.1 hypothetical protein [Gammaproteobacteria bacterium]